MNAAGTDDSSAATADEGGDEASPNEDAQTEEPSEPAGDEASDTPEDGSSEPDSDDD